MEIMHIHIQNKDFILINPIQPFTDYDAQKYMFAVNCPFMLLFYSYWLERMLERMLISRCCMLILTVIALAPKGQAVDCGCDRAPAL